MIKQYILLFFLGIGLLSCSNDHLLIKQETEILDDVFLQIVSDKYFYPVTPAPPAQITDNIDNFTDDTIKNPDFKESENSSSKLDKNRNVISIEDSTDLTIDPSIIIENLKEKGYDKLIDIFNNQSKKYRFPIDARKIKNTGKFELINRSTRFPKEFNFKNYHGLDLTFYFFGNIIFSRPFLDDSGKNGFIVYCRDCGFECERNVIFIIAKQNNKWTIIDEVSIKYAR
jgi:hypothetical protein